jgi:hypothetical protein
MRLRTPTLRINFATQASCRTAFHSSRYMPINGLATSAHYATKCLGRPCSAAACSFIALAAWVRQLPFSLLNSCVVTECLQTGHLNVLKPFIILMV